MTTRRQILELAGAAAIALPLAPLAWSSAGREPAPISPSDGRRILFCEFTIVRPDPIEPDLEFHKILVSLRPDTMPRIAVDAAGRWSGSRLTPIELDMLGAMHQLDRQLNRSFDPAMWPEISS